MLDKKADDITIKIVDQHIISFIGDERFDLSKKKDKTAHYSGDIGIFFNDDIPNIVSFNSGNDVKNWSLYLEDGNVNKYNIIQNPGTWSINPININSNSIRIKCEDTLNKKVIYDIFIDDVKRYKRIFRFRKLDNEFGIDQRINQIRHDAFDNVTT